MSDSSGGGLSDLDDIDDLKMIMQQVQPEQEQEQKEAAKRVRHRNYIYWQRLDAEEPARTRLKAMIGVFPWKFRNCPKNSVGMGNLLK
ncbi:hypothetical protein Tco_1477103 [Tanacetum coccineum]